MTGAADVVDVFVIGRTLRGSAGRAFVERVLAERERMHGARSPHPFTDIARTVELTAVAVTAVAPVSLEVSIADPAFGGAPHLREPSPGSGAGIVIALDELDGIEPIAGPPHLDLSRSAVVTVDAAAAVQLRVHVLEP